LLLERYLLDELPAERLREVKRRLEADSALRERLENLRASNASLLRAHDPEGLARRLGDRLRRERAEAELRGDRAKGRPAAWAWARPACAGALFLAIVSVPVWQTWKGGGATSAIDERSGSAAFPASKPVGDDPKNVNGAEATTPIEPRTGEGDFRDRATEPAGAVAKVDEGMGGRRPEVRLKGLQPALALFRKTADGSEPLRPGTKARPGDVLRIGYRAAGASYGAIYSVDGNGNVTRHWPTEGGRAARLEPGEHLLPGAFELDAAPDYERFYFLVSDMAFGLSADLKSLRDALRDEKAAPRGVRVIRFELLKDLGT
jgi:hypothetical protein